MILVFFQARETQSEAFVYHHFTSQLSPKLNHRPCLQNRISKRLRRRAPSAGLPPLCVSSQMVHGRRKQEIEGVN